MSVVRGALGPLLDKTIREQLSHEHQVLEGKAERITVHTSSSYPFINCYIII